MLDDHVVQERSLTSATQHDLFDPFSDLLSNRQASDNKRALLGRQPTHLIAFVLFLFDGL